ncbi:MAG: YkgJ family cysteine cluster protein [candidate division KSB1 bacterium]|nr:YkgJ family cysteine cluster protein [candidate division KSB1 bacterium]MDQ7065629.1 YkgJ family cysteine cluster protein [candidate division KSB1 bacterium]
MRQEMFYEQGLKFLCQPGCAACCKIPGHVQLSPEDAANMARLLGMPENEFIASYVKQSDKSWRLAERPDGACVMLDEQDRCRVHAARPKQCRSYPFWPEILANEFTWILEKGTCPGLDVGEYFSRDRIERILKGEEEAGGFPPEAKHVEGE